MTRAKTIAEDEDAAPQIFATSLALREGAHPGVNILECLVARPTKDGLWQVKLRSCSLSPNGSLVMHPPREKPVTVDGHVAYELLKAYEEARQIPQGDLGRVPNGAQYYTQMEDVARQARLDTAKKAGGLSKRVTLSRRRGAKPL